MAYLIKDAVSDTLNLMPKGKEFKGVVFLQTCRRMLKEHGYDKRPYDSTLLRELRKQRCSRNIVCTDIKKSIYKLEE